MSNSRTKLPYLLPTLPLFLTVFSACHQQQPASVRDQQLTTVEQAVQQKESKHERVEPTLPGAKVAHSQVGLASFYGKNDGFHGRITANGEVYDKNELTAAHREHPFDSIVRVTNLSNGKSLKVRINDRGPAIEDRIIDLSYAAARQLEFVTDGLSEVKVELLE